MVTSFISLVSSIIGYFAALGVDHLLSKWIAYATIAWEKSASERARNEYRTAMNEMVNDLALKYKDWKKWKEGLKPKE